MKNKTIAFLGPLRILVVEDTLIDRKVLEKMFKKSIPNGPKVRSTTTLRSAIKILQENEFDVVVLDLNLPDSKGEDTLIKLSKKFPHIAIVVNTGAYEDDLGLKTLGLGAQDFIIKGKYKSYGLNKAVHYAKERKRLELDLKEAQEQLVQAEKMNIVGRLASGVAHEIKNPLATILFGVAYLSESIQIKNEKTNMTIRSINESAHKANNIIKDLLDFANLSKLKKAPENLNEIIEKSIVLINHPIHRASVKITRDFDEKIPKVKVDRNRIEQVLVNLLFNAIHAMPKGGQVTVKTYVTKITEESDERFSGLNPRKKFVVLELEDNGNGIADSEMKKVFDPFFTTRRGRGGVGLGLSVARNLIEMHGGRICIENKKRKGVRATVVLPC